MRNGNKKDTVYVTSFIMNCRRSDTVPVLL